MSTPGRREGDSFHIGETPWAFNCSRESRVRSSNPVPAVVAVFFRGFGAAKRWRGGHCNVVAASYSTWRLSRAGTIDWFLLRQIILA